MSGGAGQVGLELQRASLPDGLELAFPDRAQLDVASLASVREVLGGGAWDAVINCAAWTAVDLAEDHVGEAFLANCQGPANLAEVTASLGIPLVHVSTDYVFDGRQDRPYREDDPTGPVGVYGASKLAGELAVTRGNPRSVVLRTAWVISAQRSNFLKTMLRAGTANPVLRVVADQHGCPTGAADIAEALITIAGRLIGDPAAPVGIHHFVNAGEATWHELAVRIFALAAERGLPVPEVVPITTQDYPTRAARPANSRLDCGKLARDYGITPRPWQDAVADIIHDLLDHAEDRSAVT